MLGHVVPRGLARLRMQVAHVDAARSAGCHRFDDPRHRERGEHARIQRSGSEHDRVGPRDRVEHRLWRRRGRRVEMHRIDPERAHHPHLPAHLAAVKQLRVQLHRCRRGRQHPTAHAHGNTQPAECIHQIAHLVGRLGDQQVSHRMAHDRPVERRIRSAHRSEPIEAALHNPGQQVVRIAERHQALAQVAGRRLVDGPAEATGRPAVVGHRHHSGQRVGQRTQRTQRRRQPVPTTDRDDGGRRHSRRRHFVTSRWVTRGSTPRRAKRGRNASAIATDR